MIEVETLIIPILMALCFFLVPWLIGNSLCFLFSKLKGIQTNTSVNPFKHDFYYFGVGALFLYVASIIMFNTLSKLEMQTFSPYFYGGITIASAAVVFIKTIQQTKHEATYIKRLVKKLGILGIIGFFTCLVYFIWRYDSGFNATLNWDLYNHQTLANNIVDGNFSVVTSNISDSFKFDAYTSLFHTLLALPMLAFGGSVLHYWWFLELFYLLFVFTAGFSFGYAVSKRLYVGALVSVFAGFLFESQVAYSSFFLVPQNLAGVIGIGFIAYLWEGDFEKQKGELLVRCLLFAVFILLLHYIIGLLVVAVCLAIILYKAVENKHKLVNLAVYISFACLLLVPLVFSQLQLDSINRGEAEYFNYNFVQKFYYAKDFYGYFLFIFLPLGYVYSIWKKEKLLLICCNLFLAFIIAQIPYSFKFLALGRYFMYMMMAYGVWLIVKDLHKVLKVFVFVLLLVGLGIMLVLNIQGYKQVPSYKQISSHVSPNELKAVDFLKNNYENENVLLVSDPATMYVLEGLSGINTIGGAYSDTHTREIMDEIYFSRDSESMDEKLLQTRDGVTGKNYDKLLLVLSGRTFKWVQAADEEKFGIYWNVWKPTDLSNQDLSELELIDFVEKYSKFNKVFENDAMVIFEIPKGLN
jgi:hypothetical protein